MSLRPAAAHFRYLNALRFAAACGVMVLHLAPFLSRETRPLLGSVGGLTILVDLFFALSGFVIALRYAGQLSDLAAYRTFLWQRVARLAPLHWATLAFYVLIGIALWSGLASSDHAEHYDPACLLPNALALHAFDTCAHLSFNGVSWSLSAEMGVYLLTPALLAIAMRTPAALLALALGTIVALCATTGASWLGWTWQGGVLRALPSFTIGVLFAQWHNPIARYCPAPRALAIAGIALLLVGVHDKWPQLALLPIAWAIVGSTIAADLTRKDASGDAKQLGDLTYGLYMWHPVVQTVMVTILGERVIRANGLGLDLLVIGVAPVTWYVARLSLDHFQEPIRRRLLAPRRTAVSLSA